MPRKEGGVAFPGRRGLQPGPSRSAPRLSLTFSRQPRSIEFRLPTSLLCHCSSGPLSDPTGTVLIALYSLGMTMCGLHHKVLCPPRLSHPCAFKLLPLSHLSILHTFFLQKRPLHSVFWLLVFSPLSTALRLLQKQKVVFFFFKEKPRRKIL